MGIFAIAGRGIPDGLCDASNVVGIQFVVAGVLQGIVCGEGEEEEGEDGEAGDDSGDGECAGGARSGEGIFRLLF